MTEVLDRVHVWRPYTDPPVLTAAMAGGPALVPTAELAALAAYLDAVVAARSAPVHVNVAFNAAYFGYDLGSGGYVGADLNMFATVEHGGETAALPVGAMVDVSNGASPLYGEVVYREGLHPAVHADGFVPEWLSGAPAGATDPAAGSATDLAAGDPSAPVVRSERLVLDFDAFTANFSATPTQLARLRRQGRWLDERGHVTVAASYPPLSPDASESAQYQRFLLSTARDQVMSAAAPQPLSTVLAAGAGSDALADALAGMFATVAYALSRLRSVRLWGAYALTRSSLAERLSSAGVLGYDDLSTLAVQLARSAAPPRRHAPAQSRTYTALGPLLGQISDAAPLLVGVGYPTVVAHASTAIGDFSRRESDPDTGLLAGGVHLRVDDTWQAGGVWRSQRPGVVPAGFDVTDPLGLGWKQATGSLDTPREDPQPEPEPEPEPLAEPEDPEDDGSVLNVSDSQVMWVQTLRLKHLVDSYLPVPRKVAELWEGVVVDGTELRLAVHHDGYELDPEEASQAVFARAQGQSWSMTGMSWPLGFYPALLLICTWQRGGRSVRVASTLLDFPVTVDGVPIEHRYDPAVLTSEQGERDAGAGSGSLTWPARVLRTVRRVGLLETTGRATLPEAAAVAAVCGEHAAAADIAACTAAVDELVDTGKLVRRVAGLDGRGIWVTPCLGDAAATAVLVYTPVVVKGPARKVPVPTVLQGVIATRGVDPRLLRDVEVSPHLRLLRPGHHASQSMRAAYREQRKAFQLTGPSDLPDGYTFVRSFHRGG